MKEPVALDYARSTQSHMKRLGGTHRDYAITLSNAQAFELLEWFVAENLEGGCLDQSLLTADLVEARLKDDPFGMLRYFTVLGFELIPALVIN